MIKRFLLAIAIIVLTYNVKAEGYAVNLQGNKQTGMGHVGTALNFDASSMQWNPGALATIKAKYSFAVGANLVWTKTDFTAGNYSNKTDNPINTPFYLYGSAKINNKLSAGLGIYTPFGSSNVWGDNWKGKYLIQDISMKAIFVQPTLSYKINEWISVGAGLNIIYGSFELNRAFPITSDGKAPSSTNRYLGDGQVKLDGHKIKYGYNIGVFLQPTEKLNIGISYRSQVDIDLDESEGKGKFKYPSNIPAPLVAAYKAKGAKDGSFSATLPLPSSLNLGVAYQINPKWLVSADVNYIGWDVYKSLVFTSTDSPALNSSNKRKWKNSLTYRVGAQYSVNEKLNLRCGFYYDETPVDEKYYAPETPGANKIGLTAGASYMLTKKLSIDASFIYSKGEKVDGVDQNKAIGVANGKPVYFGGEYQNTAFIPSIGITYNL